MSTRRDLDRFLAAFQTPSVFDLPTNLTLTSGAHKVLHNAATRGWVEKWEKRAISPVREEDVLFYNRLCLLYVLDVIRHGRNSLVVGLDPRGGEQIANARSAVRTFGQEVPLPELGAARFIGIGPRPAVPSRKFLHSDGLSAYLADHSQMHATLGFAGQALPRIAGIDPKSRTGFGRKPRTPK